MPAVARLRSLAAESWEWQLQGSCRGVDSAVFFHPDGERGRARADRERNAKRICRDCPVLAACREYALSAAEPYGIWGGMSEEERRRHARTRQLPPIPPGGTQEPAVPHRGPRREVALAHTGPTPHHWEPNSLCGR
nr:WhiB family transcriptional regulator [Nocardia wallacei]